MKSRIIIVGVAILACLSFALPQQDSRQDENAKKIDILTRALDIEKRRTNDLEQRLDRIDAWFRSVRAATDALDAAADEARRNGFEQAGANTLARTNVLEGMKGFASAMTRAIPVPGTSLR